MSKTAPGSRQLLAMTWRDVFVASWPVDPETVAPTLPDGLEVDTGPEGRAWLSVVGFVMEDIRPRGSPVGLSFPELNLRTYVRHGEHSGIYFYNLDADDRVGVPIARRLFELPYYRAEMDVAEHEGTIRFRSHRTHGGVPAADFDATIEPAGTPELADPGSTAAFLVENYHFFVADDDGTLYRGDVEHDPWRVQPAALTVRTNDLFAAAGFDDPAGEPLVQYAPELPVTAGRLRRVEHSL